MRVHTPPTSARRWAARIAAAGALATFAVLVAAAGLRLMQVGLGCEPWPTCYGTPAVAADSALVVALRIVHRLAASAVAVLAFVALAYAWPERAHAPARAAASATLVVLALLLALLGIATGARVTPAIALSNVGGGLTMFALFVWLASPPLARGKRSGMRSYALAALLAAAIASGVATSASLAGRACPELFGCDAAASTARAASHVGLQLAHRAAGVAAAFALAILSLVVWRRGARPAALALGTLAGAELALGAALVLLDLPLAVAIAHSATAALIVAAVVASAGYGRSFDDAPVSAQCHMCTSNQPSGTNAQR